MIGTVSFQSRPRRFLICFALTWAASLTFMGGNATAQSRNFRIEEITIAEMQRAIQNGQATCKDVVQAYIARAKTYNRICTALITKDGKPIPETTRIVRAGSPIVFPTSTVPVDKVLPDLEDY